MRISIWHEKYQTDMFENMNMIWQHKGSELICKYTHFFRELSDLMINFFKQNSTEQLKRKSSFKLFV